MRPGSFSQKEHLRFANTPYKLEQISKYANKANRCSFEVPKTQKYPNFEIDILTMT